MKKKNLFLLLTLVVCLFASCQDDTLEIQGSDNADTEQNSTRSVFADAKGLANEAYAKQGPYAVSTNAVLGDCKTLFGIVPTILKHIGLLDSSLKCSDAFPYGFSNPFSLAVYYPSNVKELDKLPVMNFVGGIISNIGNYDELGKLWASYGYVVVISSDFINVTPTMHILGMLTVNQMNEDPYSPLYQKVDLSRMVIGGHSAGGGATLLTASIPQNAFGIINPEIRIIGALPVEPGPQALGFTVKCPTFILTGGADLIVPAWAWPKLTQSNLIKDVPAWTATAITATHYSPALKLKSNEFAGISVAWLKYLGYNDKTAKSFFVGKNYLLAKDKQFYQSILNPLRVKRNSMAENLK